MLAEKFFALPIKIVSFLDYSLSIIIIKILGLSYQLLRHWKMLYFFIFKFEYIFLFFLNF